MRLRRFVASSRQDAGNGRPEARPTRFLNSPPQQKLFRVQQTPRDVLEGGAPHTPLKQLSRFEFLRGRIVLVVSAFIVGIVLFALAPGLFSARVETAGRFFGAIGAGLVALVAIAIGGTLIAVTVVGLPAAE